MRFSGEAPQDVDRARFVALIVGLGTTPAPRKSCQMGAVRRVGSRAPLQRCYNVFGGLATAKGATATDLKLCRRSAPHATRRGRSGQPPNSARTCLSTHNKRLARWFVF